MIIILTTAGDPSTNAIINWLISRNKKYMRINSINDIKEFLKVRKEPLSFVNTIEDIQTIWYRRHPAYNKEKVVTSCKKTNNGINKFYLSEL